MKELKLLLLFFSAIIVGSSLYAMAEETDSPRMVKSGNKWTYGTYYVTPDSAGTYLTETVTMSFKDTVEHNKKAYRILRTEAGDSLASMREDSGKVYLFVNDAKNIPDFKENFGEDAYYNEEILLYNFKAEEGFTLYYPYFRGDYNTKIEFSWAVDAEIEKVDTIKVNSIKYIRQDLGYMLNVEAVGPYSSYIYIPFRDLPTGYYFNLILLEEFEDEHGKFTRKDFKRPGLGVEEIVMSENGNGKDSRKYDLFGRQIENPARGTIYIQGGRKFVAK